MPKPSKSAVPDPTGTGRGQPRASGVIPPGWFDAAMAACHSEWPGPGGKPESITHLAVGCSGGADSMALTCLLKQWTDRRSIALTALIVDHGLRPEASAEAATVAGWLTKRGVNAVVLTYGGEKPASNIQAAARRIRYGLMQDWCLAQQASVLAVAHHLEDQAETFLLRLARGSGVDGLSAMAQVADLRNASDKRVIVIRPLLDTAKADLRDVLTQSDWPHVEDPSNRDIRHARVRMRNLMGPLAMEGLDARRLARTARSMRRARQALEKATDAFLAAHAVVDSCGYAGIELDAFASVDEEIALRALTRSLRLVSGGEYPLRLDRLENMATAMRSAPSPGPRTLAGCRIEIRAGRILVFREAGAIGPAVTAQPDLLWDRRFRMRLSGDFGGLLVDKLGADGVRQARAMGCMSAGLDALPGPARAALPGLWRGERLIAVGWPMRVGDVAGSPDAKAGFDLLRFEREAGWGIPTQVG